MPIGITNTTTPNITDIQRIGNFTSLEGFIVNINQLVYEGWFMFIALCVLAVILFMVAQNKQDQPVRNGMFVAGAVSIVALLLRLITADIAGTTYALVSDYQLWIFPIITIILAMVSWFGRET